MQIRLRQSQDLDGSSTHKRHSSKKRVHYDNSSRSNEKAGRVRKEDIVVPTPPRPIANRGERLVAAIMAPNDGPSRIHGLHGKKLMCAPPVHYHRIYGLIITCSYFTSVFVSLGVFLFGYDQGVMSGIIT